MAERSDFRGSPLSSRSSRNCLRLTPLRELEISRLQSMASALIQRLPEYLLGESGNQTELTPNPSTSTATRLDVPIPGGLLTVTGDFRTYPITIRGAGGALSKPAAFTVYGSGTGEVLEKVESQVVAPGETVSAKTTPSTPGSAGVAASLENTAGTGPATVTVATYTANPTPSSAFDAGPAYVDLKVSGTIPATV